MGYSSFPFYHPLFWYCAPLPLRLPPPRPAGVVGQRLAGGLLSGHALGGGNAVNLYHTEGGFFAEVFYAQHQDGLVRTRTFTSRKCLEDYTSYIRLDDLEK
jgi:hypothetical protein